nr:reverse transcriptase domain-containing protein [Tanacetum cinerariifolium]
MATNGNSDDVPPAGRGDLPVLNLRTTEELCQPTWNGRGGPIALIAIQATNFGLKNDMIQQVQNSCQFHGLPGDDANKHLDNFLHVTQSIKLNRVTDDALRLKYFPPSMVTKLRNEITNFRQRPDESLFKAWESYKLSIDRCPNHNMLPVTQIDTFYNGLTLRHCDTINAAAGGTFMKRRPEECYDLIENMTAHHNDWDTSVQRSVYENLQVKINKFIFPIDFLVLEMDEDQTITIILGRPFLATAHAAIDDDDGKLSLRVRNKVVTFNLGKSVKAVCSLDDYLHCVGHTANLVHEQWVDTLIHNRKLTNKEDDINSKKVEAVFFYPRKEPIEPLEWRALENRLNPSVKEPPKLELKDLPHHLVYTFLQEDDQLLVFISFSLSLDEKVKLIKVLKNHKCAIA